MPKPVWPPCQLRSASSDTTPDEWRREFLREWPITYVFFGPLEEKVGKFDPAQVDYLKLEYNQDGYRIYRVVEATP